MLACLVKTVRSKRVAYWVQITNIFVYFPSPSASQQANISASPVQLILAANNWGKSDDTGVWPFSFKKKNTNIFLSECEMCPCWFTCVRPSGQLSAGTCEIVTLDRDSSQPRRTIARQTGRCACRKGQIAGTMRARPACVDGETQ